MRKTRREQKQMEHLAILCPTCHLLHNKFLFIELCYKSNITLEVVLVVLSISTAVTSYSSRSEASCPRPTHLRIDIEVQPSKILLKWMTSGC